jgi:hypothetical protein
MRAFLAMLMAGLVYIILQPSPAGAVKALGRAAFATPVDVLGVLPLVIVAMLLPAWAAPRLGAGLHGWIRHLPLTARQHRRGLACALLVSEMPLVVILVVLALASGRPPGVVLQAMGRWLLVLAAASLLSLPVARRVVTVALGVVVLLLALFAPMVMWPAAAALGVAGEELAGDVRRRRRREVRPALLLMEWRVAWRSLGHRLSGSYAVGGLAFGVGWLFAVNNQLAGALADVFARGFAILATGVFLSSLAAQLAVCRPPWALARSWPWSAGRRIASDAGFLALCTIPVLAVIAWRDVWAAMAALGVLPWLVASAAGAIRGAREHRYLPRATFLAWTVGAAALVGLVPVAALAFLCLAPWTFRVSAERERRLKVTAWSDRTYRESSDPLARSAA